MPDDKIPEGINADDLQAAAASETPKGDGAKGDLDSKLSDLGFNFPADATPEQIKQIVAERVPAFQSDYSRKTQELATDRERFTQERREFLEWLDKQGDTPQKERSTSTSGPPKEGTDEEVLQWYVDKFTAEKYGSPMEQMQKSIDQLSNYIANREMDRYRERYPDWKEHEPDILRYMQQHPTVSADDAYAITTRDSVTERVEAETTKKLIERARERSSANTVFDTRGGSEEVGPLDGQNLREITDEDALDLAFQSAKKKHGI
jgi:hypothetical protein